MAFTAASAAIWADLRSGSVASPSANRSASSSAVRLRSSESDRQTLRQQATAKRRNFRPLASPFRNRSIFVGSVQASHSASVMAIPSVIVRGREDVPVADDVGELVSRPAERRPFLVRLEGESVAHGIRPDPVRSRMGAEVDPATGVGGVPVYVINAQPAAQSLTLTRSNVGLA